MISEKVAYRELRSLTCRCGGEKSRRHSFCRGCYRKLSTELRNALYKPIGRGYEAAYQAALIYLEFDLPSED